MIRKLLSPLLVVLVMVITGCTTTRESLPRYTESSPFLKELYTKYGINALYVPYENRENEYVVKSKNRLIAVRWDGYKLIETGESMPTEIIKE